MPIAWSDDLNTGHGAIDGDHREIFRRIAAFQEACQRGRGKAELEGLFEFLGDYVLKHFGEEEALMARHRFADSPEHRELHRDFRSKFAALREEMRGGPPGIHHTIAANYLLGDWWRTHICSADKAFARFLHDETAPPGGG